MNRTDIINSEKIKLSQKRINAMLKHNSLLSKLREDKEYLATEKEISKIIIELSKCELNTPEEQTLRKKYNSLVKKQEKNILKLGYKKDDLVVKFDCTKCNDSGFVGTTMCDCLKQNIRRRLQQESGLSNFKGHKFSESDIKLLESNPTLKKAYAYATEYVKNFPYNKLKNIILTGNVGTGKTFLSECIATSLIQRDYYVLYITTFDLNNIVIKSMDIFAENREELLSPLLECDLLIIDDLGSEPIYKNASVNNLYTIINQRQLANQSTIINTNLSPQMIREQYGDRLFSRLFNKQNTMAIHFDGKDLRINK